jgi:hypothetical protein
MIGTTRQNSKILAPHGYTFSLNALFAACFVDVGRHEVEEGPDLQGGGLALVVEITKRHDIPVEVIGNVLLNRRADFRQEKTSCLRTITGNLTAKFLPMVKPTAAMALVITGTI